MSDKPLSSRHQRFVQEYLKDGNATQAYIRAGYSARGAQSCASRLLAQPHIEAAVTAGRQLLAQALEITVERLGQEYAKVAFANVDDFIEVDEDGRQRIDLMKASVAQRAGVVELSVTDHGKQWQRVKLKLGKLQALAALTRQVGLFTEKPAPGLTAEDRARYEERIAQHERNWDHARERMEKLTRERDEAQIALAAAQAKLRKEAAGAPPPERAQERQQVVPQEPGAKEPPETLEQALRRQMPGMPTRLPSYAPGLYPEDRIVWSRRSHPLEPLDSEDLPQMLCDYDPFAKL